jgi:hypothetical protein
MLRVIKEHRWPALAGLLLPLLLLAGCQSAGQEAPPAPLATSTTAVNDQATATPVVEATSTMEPEATATVTAVTPANMGLLQVYENEEGGFSLMLPRDWTVGEPETTSLGTQYLLGPAPLAEAGPANSAIIVANAAETTVADLGEQLLCGGGCEPPATSSITLRNGMNAQYALIGGEGAPGQPWYFVEHQDRLIAFSIHDPERPEEALDAIIHTLTFGPILETGGEEMPALQAARLALAQELDLHPYAISLVSIESMEWTDACLGVPLPDHGCAQVITPGYKVVLEARGQQYAYHTNEEGTQVLEAPDDSSLYGNLLLSWRREGGIAGFCDDLFIYESGVVTGSSCQTTPPTDLGQAQLTPAQLSQLQEWATTLQSFQMEQSDGAVADSMLVRLIFLGEGSTAATDAQQEAISQFASELYGQLRGTADS